MTELNREQSEKADYLLEIVCNTETAINSKIAYDLFSSKDETIYVCSILEKLSLIKIISPTEGDPLYLINWTVNTCEFIKKGGFIKKYEQKNKVEKNIKSIDNNVITHKTNKSVMNNLSKKITIPILFIIIGGAFTLGLYFGNNKFDRDKISLFDENKVLKEKYDLLKDSINNIKNKN